MKTNTLSQKNKTRKGDAVIINRKPGTSAQTHSHIKVTEKSNKLNPAKKLNVEQLSHYPDPFDQKTSIVFKLSKPSCVSLVVYNADKQGMTYLVCGPKHEGYHKVDFDASNLPAGVYVARLRTDLGVEKIFMTKLGSKIPNKPN